MADVKREVRLKPPSAAGSSRAAGYGSIPWHEHVRTSYVTPKDLLQLGIHYTSVAPPPPTLVFNALRESAARIREATGQKAGA